MNWLFFLINPGLKNEHTIHLVRSNNASSGANTSSATSTAAGGSDKTTAPAASSPGSDSRSSSSPGATRGSGAAGGLLPGLGMDMNEMQRQVSRQKSFFFLPLPRENENIQFKD